jgi:hypothetical protein
VQLGQGFQLSIFKSEQFGLRVLTNGKRFVVRTDEVRTAFSNSKHRFATYILTITPTRLRCKSVNKGKTMKMTYLTLIAGLSVGIAASPQPVMAQKGQHRSGQQSHQHAQGHRERERSRTNGNVKERERERENANGVVEEQRQEQRTDGTGQSQTRSQGKTIQPHP